MADDTPEEWRNIDGYPGYQVSNLGQIRSYAPRGPLKQAGLFPHILSINRQPPGYRSLVTLYKDKKATTLLVSRLVCRTFNGEPSIPDLQAAHDDGDVYNDRATNLFWRTSLENAADRDRHGTTARGIFHYARRIWPDEAVAIRMRYDEEKNRMKRPYGLVVGLARKYSVSLACIEDIVYRRTWTNICLGQEIIRGSFPKVWSLHV